MSQMDEQTFAAADVIGSTYERRDRRRKIFSRFR